MKKTCRVIATLLIAALSAGTAAAQNTEEASLSERLDALENKFAWMPKISGFLNMRYQWSDEDKSVNSFDIRRARLDLKGDIGKKFDWRFQTEFAGGAKILDAYFRWKIDPRFNIQAGEFKIPFSLENTYGPHVLEMIDNSLVISALSSYNDISGISSNGRDIGISAYGGFFSKRGFSTLEYHVGIFNGNGINVRDNNNSKDFVGSIYIHPIKEITVSASHHNGSYGEQYDEILGNDTHQRVRTGFGARWDDKKLLVRSEYIFGKTGTMKSEGMYAVAGYTFCGKYQPLVRYDYLKTNKSERSTQRDDYVAGFNYMPIKYIRLQVNYTYRRYYGPDNNVNYICAQVFGLF